MTWADVATMALVILWRAACFGTASYVVFGLGYSGWWFVPAAFLAFTASFEKQRGP